MNSKSLPFCALLALSLSMPMGAALAETIFEVESARANARAGGPTNARDAELLDRWGALSGSRYQPPRPRAEPGLVVRTRKKPRQ